MRLLLLSTSRLHGGEFLDYCREDIIEHYEGIPEVLFIPYAQPGGISYDEYTDLMSRALEGHGLKVTGIHKLTDPSEELVNFGSVYVGGGNTFLLLKTLYEKGLIDALPPLVRDGSLRYMGSSAGTNVACPAINTTNDMPIVYPPSLSAFNLVPFSINPHYLDADPSSRHMGESRETRIREFQTLSDRKVIGLREGSWLKFRDGELHLGGDYSARCFERDKEAWETDPGDDLSFLMNHL